jgi:hypothetical protein
MAMNEASLLPVEDYEAIEAAVKETNRGRWFLDEYARRNRHADTLAIVATLERLEKTIKVERSVPDIDRIRLDLADMAEAIVRTKHEISQIQFEGEHGNRFQQASNELDAIVIQTEGATNDILLNAERIQELAWTLREQGVDETVVDGLDTAATDIYTSCSFQDLTGQRTRKVVTVLRYLESRINAMMSIWGLESLVDSGLPMDMPATADPMDTRPDAHLLNGPQLIGHGNNQDSVDDIMIDESALASIAADEVEAMLQPHGEVEEFAAAEHAAAAAAATRRPDVLADDLDLVAAPEDEVAAAEPALFAPTVTEAAEPDLAPLEVDPADYREADVFAPASPAPAVETAPAVVRQRVGNTVQEVVVEAEVAPEQAAELIVVGSTDPIADLTPERRLVTFG